MNNQFGRIALLAIIFMLCQVYPVHAGFFIKRTMQSSIGTSSAPLPDTSTHMGDTHLSTLSAAAPASKHKSGFLAWLSIGCGVLGLAVASIHTIVFLLILGLIAGISGKIGRKAFKHRKTLRMLSTIGMVLGIVLLILATIPALLLFI